MNAYEHYDIIEAEGDLEKSKVEVSFKCKEIGGKEYIVNLDATVYLEFEADGGDRWTRPTAETYLKDITIDHYIISDIEDRALHINMTDITEEFMIEQVKTYCVEL